jgi:hypothetical protein
MCPEGLCKFKKHLIGYRTRDVPVCSIVPLPLRYRLRWVRRADNLTAICVPIVMFSDRVFILLLMRDAKFLIHT